MNFPRPSTHAAPPSATRILVIEDDDAFRGLIGEALVRSGYQVHTAADGITGLKELQHGPFDLVITDMIMPGKDGIETILELRQLAPDAKVIAISGGGRIGAGDFLPLARTLGASATLPKPFGLAELMATVSAVLGQASNPGQMELAG